MMNDEQLQAVLAIALLAAHADGRNTDAERDEVRRVGEALGAQAHSPALLRDVLLKRVDVAAAAAKLPSDELRRLAYEFAVGVCDADGARSPDETRFLDELADALGVSAGHARSVIEVADTLASVPLEAPVPDAAAGATTDRGAASAGARAPAGAPGDGPVVAATPRRPRDEIDKTILNYAILNGALELLPQSTATMAIIPLQMKMVHQIGKDHGYELDRGHIKDFLATIGVGLTGQYLEEIGRKLVGRIFGKAGGRMFGGLARGATGAAFSFATTWALGQVAMRYYAGGRVMSTQLLKDAYTEALGQAGAVQSRYLPQIEERARSIDVGRIVQMVRSQ